MFPIRIKDDVRLDRLQPQMVFALLIMADTYLDLFAPTITGGNETEHPGGDPHDHGEAIDVRAHHLTEHWHRTWALRIQQRLGPEYVVMVEIFPDDPSRNHIHIQHRRV